MAEAQEHLPRLPALLPAPAHTAPVLRVAAGAGVHRQRRGAGADEPAGQRDGAEADAPALDAQRAQRAHVGGKQRAEQRAQRARQVQQAKRAAAVGSAVVVCCEPSRAAGMPRPTPLAAQKGTPWQGGSGGAGGEQRAQNQACWVPPQLAPALTARTCATLWVVAKARHMAPHSAAPAQITHTRSQ